MKKGGGTSGKVSQNRRRRDSQDEEDDEDSQKNMKKKVHESDDYSQDEEDDDDSQKRKQKKRVSKKKHDWRPPPSEIVKSPRATGNRKHVPGQPRDTSLLIAYKDHVAKVIWETANPRKHVRDVKILHHHSQLVKWKLGENEEVNSYVQKSGFDKLIKYTHKYLDVVLINAFLERFYPETCTFHFPFGEMTIVINDIVQILGLPVEGKAVMLDSEDQVLDWERCYELCRNVLGLDKNTCNHIFARFDEDGIEDKAAAKVFNLKWLRENFSSESLEPREPRHVAAAYLLYVIGTVVLGDHSSSTVSASYLFFLEDIENVNRYSWGTACLSHLYSCLGKSSGAEFRELAGNMTLLTVWIYEHFVGLHDGVENNQYEEGQVRADRWLPVRRQFNADELVRLRLRIDDLQADEVIWDPYKRENLHKCCWYNGPIACLKTAMPYNPLIVLRQFGYVQTEPTGIEWPNRKLMTITAKEFNPKVTNVSDWNSWVNHLVEYSNLQQVSPDNSGEAVPGYMDKYLDYSHPYVSRTPSRRRMLECRLKAFNAILRSVFDGGKTPTQEQIDTILEMCNRSLDPNSEEFFTRVIDAL